MIAVWLPRWRGSGEQLSLGWMLDPEHADLWYLHHDEAQGAASSMMMTVVWPLVWDVAHFERTQWEVEEDGQN